ncbi:hypothetical protein ACFLWA_03300 [Chloroflexota bacterium]
MGFRAAAMTLLLAGSVAVLVTAPVPPGAAEYIRSPSEPPSPPTGSSTGQDTCCRDSDGSVAPRSVGPVQSPQSTADSTAVTRHASDGDQPLETGASSVTQQSMPAALPPGTVIDSFANTWRNAGTGLVYDPSRNSVRYAHGSPPTTGIWDVDYALRSALGSLPLSVYNPGWPASLDFFDGAAYDPGSDLYFLADYNGDVTNADDHIVEITPGGTILNAWEMDNDVGSNDSYDGSAINLIIDVAVVTGDPPRYFAAANGDGSIVYEIDLIQTGTWWQPGTWGTLNTCAVTGLVDNAGIDYDAENGLLYHSDRYSTAIVVTDLECNVLDSYTCAGTEDMNTGVTFIEGRNRPEIWVTDYTSNRTTICAATETAACQWGTLFSDEFEGSSGNWSATGLWNREAEGDTCGSKVAPFPSASTAMYYGQDGVCHYNTGAHNSGELAMGVDVDLTTYSHAILRFWSYEETECGGGCPWDKRYVDVSTSGGANWITVWESTGPEGVWYQAYANLWDYVGGPVRIRFRFDSIDSGDNSHFGWLVDDVEIATCPRRVFMPTVLRNDNP